MVATVVVLVAILFGTARLLLPYVSDYKTDISKVASDYLGQTINVERLDAEWRGLGPSLVLKNVELMEENNARPVLQFSEARLEFNVITSLIFLRPELSNITLVGVDIGLVRDKSGEISVVGVGDRKGESTDSNAIAEWIASQGEIRLEKSKVSWRDEMNHDREMHFSSINIRLRNSLTRHLLDASIDLPENLGRSLIFHVDVKGDLLHITEQEIKAYFYGEQLKLTEFLQTQSIAGKSANVGETNFQLWAYWKDGVLHRTEGEIDVENLSLFSVEESQEGVLKKESNASTISLKRLAGEFKWQKTEKGWKFDGNDLIVVREKQNVWPSRVSIDIKNGASSVESIDAYASHLQLEDAAQFLKLFSVGGDEFKASLQALHPRGLVHDARVQWRGGENPTYKAYARLDRASSNAWKFIPAADNIYGQLWLNESSGQAVLDKAEVTLDFPSLFRWPIDIAEVGGQVDWTVGTESWSLMGNGISARNDDISASASFNLVKDNTHKSPFMSLVAHFKDGDGSQVAHYLPTGIMPNSAVNWLDTAIVGGHVKSGGMIMHGRLSDFPYVYGNGKFEVRFSVEEGRLDYAKGWPAISDIDADVRFIGRSMSINAKHGKIFSNEILWARVDLPSMSVLPMPLVVDGDISGNSQDKLRYLVKSPQLRESFGKHLEGMTAEGNSTLHLDLVLPIGDYQNTAVSGSVDLKDNSLVVPALGRVLSGLDGSLNFSQDGLSMDAVHADLFGQRTDLKVVTESVNNNKWIRINASGLFDTKKLAETYLPPIANLVDGKGNVDVRFNIPLGGHDNGDKKATLHVGGDFKDVETKLPPPLSKKAREPLPVNIDIDFQSDTESVMRASYGENINGIFVLNNKEESGIKSGELRVNSGLAVMPETEGLKVIGELENVALNEWLSIWPENSSFFTDKKTRLPRIQQMDYAIGNLEVLGQQLHGVRLSVTPVENGWNAVVRSKEMTGQMTVPKNISVNPVSVNLDYAYLSEPHLSGGKADPRDIPSLNLQVRDLRYESRNFGSLKLETTRVANGVRIEQIVLKPRDTEIIANGSWYINGEEHISNIVAHLQSTNVGKTLKELGYVGTVSGGDGGVDLQLQWPAAFYDIEAGNVQGVLQMDLKNGQLLEIEPGAGRLFGMLSLQTLPRRLFLDFSDVFAKGFGFDSIKGNFTIEKGNAYTSKLKLDGPAAKIEIKGRVGLVQQDYDQLVTVTPKVSESLPVLGALTSTPQIGAVILFFQKLFQPNIEEATKNQYSITGHWDNPVVKKLTPTRPKNPEPEKNINEGNPFVQG